MELGKKNTVSTLLLHVTAITEKSLLMIDLADVKISCIAAVPNLFFLLYLLV